MPATTEEPTEDRSEFAPPVGTDRPGSSPAPYVHSADGDEPSQHALSSPSDAAGDGAVHLGTHDEAAAEVEPAAPTPHAPDDGAEPAHVTDTTPGTDAAADEQGSDPPSVGPASAPPADADTTSVAEREPAVAAPDHTQIDDESPTDRSPGPVPGLAGLRLPDAAASTLRASDTAIVVGIANQKGGVGKTTTTVSLAAALAQAGVRTLVVDLDPQGNATTGLGLRAEEGDRSSYGVLVEGTPVPEAIMATEVANLEVLPSSLDLAGAEVELVPAFSRELRLRKALEEVKDRYDIIFVDCPPSLGLLTINALVASDQVLVPIQCEYYALEGLGQLMRTVQLVSDNLNRDLELGGVVLTMYDARTKLSQQVVDEVRAYFGDKAYRTVIPRTVRLSEAPSFGQPITTFDPGSRGARSYERLASEVIERLGLPSDAPPEPADGRSALDRLLGGPAPEQSAPPETPRPDPSQTNPDAPEGQP